ncbi:MAG: hypothetical protein IKN10_03700 [Muribaculaceae bacterium]|nr:hypothetical protein [Muribaculaceae bacterium]
MKRIIILFFAIMACITIQAQSICGTWRTVQASGYDSMRITYTFKEDGTGLFSVEADKKEKLLSAQEIEIVSKHEIKGTYTLDGDQLTFTPNVDTYTADVTSITIDGKRSFDPNIKSRIRELVNSPVLKAHFVNVDTLTVIELTDTKLVIDAGEEIQEYARIGGKKKKK